jgi:hypothetical protein
MEPVMGSLTVWRGDIDISFDHICAVAKISIWISFAPREWISKHVMGFTRDTTMANGFVLPESSRLFSQLVASLMKGLSLSA